MHFSSVQSTVAAARPQTATVVTIGAGTTAEDPANTLLEIRFAAPQNASIDVGAMRDQRGPFTYVVPSGTAELTFSITRLADGPYFVPFTVVDEDGEWSTFLGEGR